MEIIILHDMINPKTGRTYKEDNMLLKHKYSIGDLVEIIGWNEGEEQCAYAGMRLYIIGLIRDCDGTPLYVLGSRDTPLNDPRTEHLYHPKSYSGFGEESLKLIKP